MSPAGFEQSAILAANVAESQPRAANALHEPAAEPDFASLLASLAKLSPEQRQAIVAALTRDTSSEVPPK